MYSHVQSTIDCTYNLYVHTCIHAYVRTKRLNAHFFHHCASIIKKFFRGWWSRKHLHDYYGRKAYLQKVEADGERTKEYLASYHQKMEDEAKSLEEGQMRCEFDSLAGELHHLVSTKSIAGVYNSANSEFLIEIDFGLNLSLCVSLCIYPIYSSVLYA